MRMRKKMTSVVSGSLLAAVLAVPSTGFAVKDITVEADNDATGKASAYTIEFELEEVFDSGDYIVITFPEEMELPDDIDESDIDVEGHEPQDARIKNGNELWIYMDEAFNSGAEIKIEIDEDAGLINPDEEGDYTLYVRTENEDDDEESDKFSINKDDSDDDGDDEKGSLDVDISQSLEDETEVTLQFEAASDYAEGDTLKVKFPFDLPSDMDEADVSVNDAEPDSVTVDGDILEIKLSENIEDGDDVEIVISEDAGIETPSEETSGYFEIDAEGDKFESDEIEFSDDYEEENFNLSLSSDYTGEETSFEFEIELDGQEVKEGDEITIEFPDEEMLPSSIDEEDITINGLEVDGVSVDEDVVTIEVPEDYDSDETLEFEISEDAGITTPDEEGDDYRIYVTIDGDRFESEAFEVEDEESSNNSTSRRSEVAFSINNDSTDTPVGVHVELRDGPGDDLEKRKDYIAVVFPSGFQLPSSILSDRVTINGERPYKTEKKNSSTVLLYLNEDIDKDEDVDIVFSSTAGIRTPTYSGSFKLGVYTSEDSRVNYSGSVNVNAPIRPPVTTKTIVLTIDNKSAAVNGVVQQLDAPPYIYKSRTLVPIRFISEIFGAKVEWDDKTKSAIILDGSKRIVMTLNSNIASVNGFPKPIDVPVQVKNGRSMVPVRFVVEQLGAQVEWNNQTDRKSVV